MQKSGMNYYTDIKSTVAAGPGEFKFSVIGLDHGHIYGMSKGLITAGAEIKWVYDPDREKINKFRESFPEAMAAESEEQVLNDSETKLIASACITSERAPLGVRVMRAGKDYFSDKAPATTLEQLQEVRKTIEETGRIYAVNYSEHIQSEAALFAGKLIRSGAIGKVIQVAGLGPHRLNASERPGWFFNKAQYGGILCDIGSHQIEQFLYFADAMDARVLSANIGNYNNPQYPELDDFGTAELISDNGVSCYFRVDWFTPDGLRTWGDGRTFILGTEGFIELRKYIDIARENEENNVYWADREGEHHENVSGKMGLPYFGELILDCINRTHNAMPQERTLRAAELCIEAQMMARELTGREIRTCTEKD